MVAHQQASHPPGRLVVVRAWGQPDEHYYAVILDPREAEERVRDAVQAAAQVSVQSVRELAGDELEALGLQPGKIIRAPDK